MNCSNDQYEKYYKSLEYDIGRYQGAYECILRLYELIFGDTHLDRKRRIKYLSNIELDTLIDMMYECIENMPVTKDEDTYKYESSKAKTLEFLK